MLIRNKTLSPYDLIGVGGPVRLPALGEVEGEFSGEYLQILEASLAVEVIRETKPKAKAKPASAAKPAVEGK